MAKSRPTMNLLSQALARSSLAQKSGALNRPGTFRASSGSVGLIPSTGKFDARDSSSQVRQTITETTSAKKIDVLEVAQDTYLSTGTWKRAVEDLKIVEMDSQFAKKKKCHIFGASEEFHCEKVFSRLQQKMGRKLLDGLDTNSLTWELFLSTTFEAAVQLGTH